MRIINKTDEAIVIEPGEDIDVRGDLDHLRTTASRVRTLEIQEVDEREVRKVEN